MIVEAVPQLASLDEEDITGVIRQSASVTSKLLLVMPPPTLARAVTEKYDNIICVRVCLIFGKASLYPRHRNEPPAGREPKRTPLSRHAKA